MKKIIKIAPILFLLTFISSKAAEKTYSPNTKWCLHNKITTQNGNTIENKTTLIASEKALKNAINRLKKLYDTQKSTFAELNTKCVSPNQPISPRGIKILQNLHIANKNGEIYKCYKNLVPIVFKITRVNPPKSRFVNFEELVKTGMITKQK